MRATVLFALCVMFVAPISALGKPGENVRKTIVLIGHKPDHPPKTHMYLPTCELLAACLRQTKGVEASVASAVTSSGCFRSDSSAVS